MENNSSSSSSPTSDQPQQNDDTAMDLEHNNTSMETAHNESETKFICNKDQHGGDHLREGKEELESAAVKSQTSTTQQQTTTNEHQQSTDIQDTTADQVDEKNAPPSTTITEHHIPGKKFAPLLTELLLDQNSNLASLGQQCIVSVAAELASTPPDSDRAALDRFLLDTEIFDGVVMGLMDIVHGKSSIQQQQQQQQQDDDENQLSANLSATSIGTIQRRPSTTTGFESSSPAAAISPVDEDSRQGEINLAKMMCLTVRQEKKKKEK